MEQNTQRQIMLIFYFPVPCICVCVWANDQEGKQIQWNLIPEELYVTKTFIAHSAILHIQNHPLNKENHDHISVIYG